MQGTKILIIEDDVHVRQAIAVTFEREGAAVISAPDGESGLRQFYQHQPALVVLDVMMPHTDGWETIRQIRRVSDTPVIMLTAIRSEEAEIRALDSGAVDFVNKPFSPKVLVARAKVALRRAGQQLPAESTPVYRDSYLEIDLERWQVSVKGTPVKLTKTEFELLAYLLRHKNRILTFEQILFEVWGAGYEANIEYTHVYISRLRRKLEEDPRNPIYLIGEHGVGYRFMVLGAA